MSRRWSVPVVTALALALAPFLFRSSPARAAETPAKLVTIPAGKDTDIKVYGAENAPVTGEKALAEMRNADLVLWIAGNQFFAMDEVIGRFRKRHTGLRVGLITLPPGLVLQAIKAGGWRYGATTLELRPDLYASVNLGHLQELMRLGMMQDYMTYMHNELQLIVAENNPKKIAGIADLVRPDVRTSMPNPVNEGIMQFYGRKLLERRGLWAAISAGQECVSCQTTPNNWFTAVHHRETPERIRAGLSDTGLVWRTEVIEAIRDGSAIEGVELPPEDSLKDEVAYVVGALREAPHREAADAYLRFLASEEGQAAYASFGFVRAAADELRSRPIP